MWVSVAMLIITCEGETKREQSWVWNIFYLAISGLQRTAWSGRPFMTPVGSVGSLPQGHKNANRLLPSAWLLIQVLVFVEASERSLPVWDLHISSALCSEPGTKCNSRQHPCGLFKTWNALSALGTACLHLNSEASHFPGYGVSRLWWGWEELFSNGVEQKQH